MAGAELTVEGHYTRAGLGELIFDALRHAGKEIDALTVDDLAPMDEFHVRGRDATLELARLVTPTADLEVVDIGCGIGGPSHFLAARFGCRVTGIELTDEYCQVATMLAERTGLSDRVRYRRADATATTPPDESVDLVWTQHASMNIGDKPRLYAEMFRILKPGGRLALHDIMILRREARVRCTFPYRGPGTRRLASSSPLTRCAASSNGPASAASTGPM